MQVTEAFNQHGIAEKKQYYLGINALTMPIVYNTYISNKYTYYQ